MENYEIKNILKKNINLDKVYVNNENNHFQITVISKIFHGLSLLKKEQMINSLLMEYIINNKIHSLSVKAYTPSEWEQHNISSNNL